MTQSQYNKQQGASGSSDNGYRAGGLGLSFGRRTSGDISEQIEADVGKGTYFVKMGGEVVTRGGEDVLLDSVNGTKKRLITDLNINLKSSDVSAKIDIIRRNANGSPSIIGSVGLKKFNTMGAFQENKYTIGSRIYLEDGDSMRLTINNTSTSSVNVDIDGTYEILGS
jgi:hypothetical protein